MLASFKSECFSLLQIQRLIYLLYADKVHSCRQLFWWSEFFCPIVLTRCCRTDCAKKLRRQSFKRSVVIAARRISEWQGGALRTRNHYFKLRLFIFTPSLISEADVRCKVQRGGGGASDTRWTFSPPTGCFHLPFSSIGFIHLFVSSTSL